MPCRTRNDQSLPKGLCIDDGNIDIFGLASVGADGDQPSIRGHSVMGQMVLHPIAFGHCNVLDLSAGAVHIHLPSLGPAPMGGAVEVACRRPGASVHRCTLEPEQHPWLATSHAYDVDRCQAAPWCDVPQG